LPPSRSSRKTISDGELTDFVAIDYDRKILAGHVVEA
jgi:hypothetical protein